MRLRDVAFLVDENIHPEVVTYLREHGFDVLNPRDSDLVGVDDVVLIRKALAENRIIITHDSDFGTLAILAGEPTLGIIYLRPGHIGATFTSGTIRVLLDQDLDLQTPFIVVAHRKGNVVKIRIRSL